MECLRIMRVRAPPEMPQLPMENRLLYATNPSVIALPKNYRRSLRAVYLATMKVQNHNNCYRPMSRLPAPCIVLVGFRLLDAQFKTVLGREALIRWSERPADSTCSKTNYEDCRLVAHDARLLLVCKTFIHTINFSLASRTPEDSPQHPVEVCRRS